MKSLVQKFLQDQRFSKGSKRNVLLSLGLFVVSLCYYLLVSLGINGTTEFSGNVVHIGHYYDENDPESAYIELTLEGETVEIFQISTLMYNEMDVAAFFERVKEGEFITVAYFNSALNFLSGKSIYALHSSSFSENNEGILQWHENVEKWTFVIISLILILIALMQLFSNYQEENETGSFNNNDILRWQNITILLLNAIPVFIILFLQEYDDSRLHELQPESMVTSKTFMLVAVLIFAILNFILLFPLKAWSYESSKPHIQKINKVLFILIGSPIIGLFFVMNLETYLNYTYKSEELTIIVGEIIDKYEDENTYEIIITAADGEFTKYVNRSFFESIKTGQMVLIEGYRGGWQDYYVKDNKIELLEEEK